MKNLALIAVSVASTAVLAGACGGGGAVGVAHISYSGRAATSRRHPAGMAHLSSLQEGIAHSECMRSHGLPNFPDPGPQGAVRMSSSGSGIDVFSPKYQAAAKTCQKLEPTAGQSTSPPGAQLMPEALKFAACMRAHGIVNFADPKPIGNYGMILTIPRSLGIDQGSPQFLAANKICQPLMNGNGPGDG
jgi:hypothetical protein